jgi:hypothetical protein
VKSIVPVVLLALIVLVGAGRSGSGTGLRGTVLIVPGSPTCQPGTPCSRPAAHVLLRFWRDGRAMGHTRTDARGRFRIGLRPHTYRVTSRKGATLKPSRVYVPTSRFRRVTFKLDVGIR